MPKQKSRQLAVTEQPHIIQMAIILIGLSAWVSVKKQGKRERERERERESEYDRNKNVSKSQKNKYTKTKDIKKKE